MSTRLASLLRDAVGHMTAPGGAGTLTTPRTSPNSFTPPTGVIGFDGFVDEMCAVIGARGAKGEIQEVGTIAEFGKIVSDAAGRSFGRELSVKRVEPGGNAPNLAEGLMSLGFVIDFFGTLGDPIEPVFSDFKAGCRTCKTLGACGRTTALEFGDGKLQLSKTERLAELGPAVMEEMLETTDFAVRCEGAALLGFANWSRYPYMTACWRVLTERVLSRLTHRPWLMVDLADPSGRDGAEIREMLALVGRMAETCRVVFGANLNEAGVLLEAAGVRRPGSDADGMELGAARLREHCGAQMAVIHSQKRAAAAWSDGGGGGAGEAWARGNVCVDGAYNERPIRTTGVGDRFNAGLAAALVAGASPASAVAMGCAAGAWFVTEGRSLGTPDLPGLAAYFGG